MTLKQLGGIIKANDPNHDDTFDEEANDAVAIGVLQGNTQMMRMVQQLSPVEFDTGMNVIEQVFRTYGYGKLEQRVRNQANVHSLITGAARTGVVSHMAALAGFDSLDKFAEHMARLVEERQRWQLQTEQMAVQSQLQTEQMRVAHQLQNERMALQHQLAAEQIILQHDLAELSAAAAHLRAQITALQAHELDESAKDNAVLRQQRAEFQEKLYQIELKRIDIEARVHAANVILDQDYELQRRNIKEQIAFSRLIHSKQPDDPEIPFLQYRLDVLEQEFAERSARINNRINNPSKVL